MWWKINRLTSRSMKKRPRFCTLLYIFGIWGLLQVSKYEWTVKGDCILTHCKKNYFTFNQFLTKPGLWHENWHFLANRPYKLCYRIHIPILRKGFSVGKTVPKNSKTGPISNFLCFLNSQIIHSFWVISRKLIQVWKCWCFLTTKIFHHLLEIKNLDLTLLNTYKQHTEILLKWKFFSPKVTCQLDYWGSVLSC